MTKLIRADIFRCFRDSLFRLAAVVCPIAGWWFGVDTTFLYGRHEEPQFKSYVMVLYVLIVLFVTLFYARESYDKTIRCKIIVGNTRAELLISRLVTAIFIGALFFLLYAVPYFAAIICNDSFVFLHVPAELKLSVVVGLFCSCCLWAVIAAAVSTLISARAVGEVVNVTLVCVCIFISGFINAQLSIPQYNYDNDNKLVLMTDEEIAAAESGHVDFHYDLFEDDDGVERYYRYESIVIREDNTDYLDYPLRYVFQGADDILPTSQLMHSIECWSYYTFDLPMIMRAPEELREFKDFGYIQLYPLYTIGAAAVIWIVGITLFRKRDLS